MEHPGQAHVLHIGRLAGDLGRKIRSRNALADDPVIRRRLRLDGAGRLAPQGELLGELAIRDPPAISGRDGAVPDLQSGRRHAELAGRLRDQQRPDFGARQPQGRATVLDRLAPGSLAFIGRPRRIT